jgi:hypothetical protein
MNRRCNQGSGFRALGSRLRRARSLLAWVALGSTSFAAGAGTLELVSHNGFEQCWSSAVTVPAFLQSLESDTEGRDVCMPPAQDGSSCATSQCSSGAPGCSATLRGAEYAAGTIDTQAGYLLIDAATGFDPFSMPVIVPLVGACTANFVDTTGVLLQYQLQAQLRPDGNSGYYAYDAQVVNIIVTGLDADDVSLSGGFGCQLASLGMGFYVGLLSDQLGSQIALATVSSTKGESFCPLP